VLVLELEPMLMEKELELQLALELGFVKVFALVQVLVQV
jgi:hypothetical protein